MEYTKEKFEALEANHAEALKGVAATAVTGEKERVSGILALSGDDAVKAKAIEDGSTVGDTAIALNATQAETISTMKTDFEEAGASMDNIDEEEVVDSSEEDIKLKEANAALENYGGKK